MLTPRPGSTQLSPGSSAGDLTPNNQQDGITELHIINMLPKSHLACRHPKTPQNVTLIIRVKSQLHTPKHRHQSLPPGRLHKSLDQLHPPGHRQQTQEELWLCKLWKGDHKHSNLDKMR